MIWIFNILSVFFICILCTGVLIPKILLVSFRKKLFDVPDERKIHHNPIPRLGGFAFVPVILFSISYTIGLDFLLNKSYVISYYGDHILSAFVIELNFSHKLFVHSYCRLPVFGCII